MKTAFENSMIAHIWAQQNQADMCSGNGNFSFRNSVLYSYTQPIAAFVKGTRGRRFALVTSESFSMTTTKHISDARHSLSGVGVFIVPRIVVSTDNCLHRYHSGSDSDMHAVNVAHLTQELRDYGKRLTRFNADFWSIPDADKSESRCQALRELYAVTVAEYCEAFGVRKGAADRARELESMCDAIIKAHVKYNDPKSIAKRAKAVANRAVKAESAMAAFTLWEAGNGPRPSMAGLPSFERRKMQRDIEREGMAAKRAAWIAGEPVIYSDYSAPVALRVRSGNLETSQGAKVPLDHAVKVFRFVKLVRGRGEPWQANGQAVRVGHFKIDSISAGGDMVAGCHKIPWEETERVARAIGVYDESPDDSACESRETVNA